MDCPTKMAARRASNFYFLYGYFTIHIFIFHSAKVGSRIDIWFEVDIKFLKVPTGYFDTYS